MKSGTESFKMLTLILLSVLVALITYVCLRWIHLKQYWATRNVPHLPPHPLYGSMTFLLKENTTIWLRRMYDRFKEPYVGIWLFWRPGLLVHSPEIAKNILIKDQAFFRNRLASSGTTDPVGSLNIFALNDPLWSVLRRRLSFLFTSSKLKGLQNLVTKKSKELVERIDKERQKTYPMDLRTVMTDFTTDIIGTSTFGVVMDATLTGKCVLSSVTKDFMSFSIIRGIAWCCGFFIPEFVDIFRFKLFPVETTEYMRKILRKIITQRGGYENKVTDPRDLLDILIKLKQEGSEELDVTENMIVAQAAVFLQGGFETTATSITFAIYELANSPEVQEKLYQELKKAKDEYGDELLDASVLARLVYLNCVVNEGLRKYPIMGWLDRVAFADYKVDDHLTIKAGTPVFVNAMGLHYDPDFYPDPDRFNPDRFLPENEGNLKTFAHLPFGEGPRKCIGQRLGLSNVRHGLAAVILSYEVRPLPNSPKPSDLKMQKKGLFLAPEGILSVEFIPRVM